MIYKKAINKMESIYNLISLSKIYIIIYVNVSDTNQAGFVFRIWDYLSP
jgi:hypothetical protein